MWQQPEHERSVFRFFVLGGGGSVSFGGVFLFLCQGNPVCREVEYRFTVLAYIKNITYHDYATVDLAEVLQV